MLLNYGFRWLKQITNPNQGQENHRVLEIRKYIRLEVD